MYECGIGAIATPMLTELTCSEDSNKRDRRIRSQRRSIDDHEALKITLERFRSQAATNIQVRTSYWPSICMDSTQRIWGSLVDQVPASDVSSCRSSPMAHALNTLGEMDISATYFTLLLRDDNISFSHNSIYLHAAAER